MAKKTPLEKLSADISKILTDYADGVLLTADEVTKKIGQKGASAVKAESKSKGWGENTGYDKGWKAEIEKTRLSCRAIIYNEKAGLVHLLEHSHAKRGGGRTNAFPHVSPIEEELQEEYYKAMREAL